MGCGKSSVGRRLSTLLSCSYVDLDSYIEEAEGRSIPEIFASDGEGAFRKMELEALEAVVYGQQERVMKPCYPSGRRRRGPSLAMGGIVSSPSPADLGTSSNIILSLGGGTVMTGECAEIVNRQTVCIYLRASVDTLVGHLENESEGRPMLAGGDIRSRVTKLMGLRASTYEKTAHIIIDTDGKSVEDICLEIDSCLKGL